MTIKDKVMDALMTFDPHIDPNIPHLQIGHQLENFDILLSSKRTTDLNTLLNNGPLLLVFIKGTWCPFCQHHMGKLKKWYEKVNKNVALIIISSESCDVINSWLKQNPFTYLFASDPDCYLGKMFGVFKSKENYNQASTFLIDVDKKIRLAQIGRRSGNYLEKTEEACTECIR